MRLWQFRLASVAAPWCSIACGPEAIEKERKKWLYRRKLSPCRTNTTAVAPVAATVGGAVTADGAAATSARSTSRRKVWIRHRGVRLLHVRKL